MKRILYVTLALLLCASQTSFAASKLKLIIDAGHGGTDEGSKSKAGDKESDLCLDIANAIKDYAVENGIDVGMTRTKKNQKLTHEQRSGHHAEPGIKTFYISVHFDADKDPSVHGARVRYSENAYGSADAKRLANTVANSLNKINSVPTKIEAVDAVIFMRNRVPSIMIEPGRMNSADDLQKIKNKSYQKEVAMFIVQAAMAQ